MTSKQKIFTYCMIGTLGFSFHTTTAKAEEIPIAGIDLVLDDLFQIKDNDSINIKDILSLDIKSFNNQTPKESEQFKDISFAQVSSYVNIRDAASEEGKIIGKLYDNCAAYILDKSGDWYKVKSGKVVGYIKEDYLITGEKAEKLIEKVGKQIAVVTTTTLKIRDKASLDSPVLTLVPIDEELIVKKELDDWYKVVYEGNKTGFVSADYVKIRTEFEEGVSIEEEQERLEEERNSARREEEQSQNGQNSNRPSNTNTNSNTNSNTNNDNIIHNGNSNTGGIRNKIVQYAMRFNGNPYVWGGTSLTHGADCSGFTQSVFRDNGIYISRTSRTQAVGGRRVSVNEMQPGDLIFYDRSGTINHVGIYIGNGKVISASSPETGIRISRYNYRTPVKVVSYIS